MLDYALNYYGIDWGALLFGLMGCYFITRKNRTGFIFSTLGCICGLIVAFMSGQYGFIVYNIILIVMMARGYRAWNGKNDIVEVCAE